MSRVSELLDCPHPVIQGAMGVISNPEMVAAVSEAGGFGLLASTMVLVPAVVDAAEADLAGGASRPPGSTAISRRVPFQPVKSSD